MSNFHIPETDFTAIKDGLEEDAETPADDIFIPDGTTEEQEEEDEVKDEEESTPETTPPPDAPLTLSPEEYQTYQYYRELDNRIKTDPEFANRLQQAFGPPVQQTPPTPPPPAIDIDPAVKAYLDAQLASLAPVIQRHDAYVNVTQQRENDAAIHRAKESFKKDHNLTDAQMDQVYTRANTYAPVLGSLLSQGHDTQTALTETFGMAYYQIPEFRQHEAALESARNIADGKRKAKAGSLTGSSGSAPRTPAAPPSNENERRNAMIAELANHITPGGES